MKNLEVLQSALETQRWKAVNQALLAKMLAEFMYEDIISPEIIQKQESQLVYELSLTQDVVYRFTAISRLMDSYRVFPESIERQQAGEGWKPATQALQFLLDIQETIGMSAITTAHLIKEVSNTLVADAHLRAKQAKNPTDLLQLSYAKLEGEMEGHPWIIYNKGRIGFNYSDYLQYAPESQQEISFFWIAVRNDRAKFNAVTTLSYQQLLQEELGESQVKAFQEILEKKGLNPEDYYFMPVHDWQWETHLFNLFAEEIATDYIVPLARSEDRYLPQQSIRTFLNVSHSKKRNVKVPISILNTSIYRGLPGAVLAPYMTEWLKEKCDRDPFLSHECRIILVGEVAGVQYYHPYYTQLSGGPYQYREMLACIWRESVFSYLESDEKPVTLASLLHIDGQGKPFISQLVEQSGLSLSTWLDKLFQAILPPLLHYLYQYGTVFSPHGENVILILQDAIPVRIAIKDFLDDVNISNQPLPELETFPAEIKPFFLGEKNEKICQYIFAGLFVCHFRYLADLLETEYDYSEEEFWLKVRQTILNYQSRFPELKSRFETFNLLAPTFTKLCLNRTRLLGQGYADESGNRPAVTAFGKVRNALDEVAFPSAELQVLLH